MVKDHGEIYHYFLVEKMRQKIIIHHEKILQMNMIILMNGVFKVTLRKRMHHKVKRTIWTKPPKYPKTKIMLPLHQDFLSKQEYVSKENTDLYRTKMDSSISDTLSGEYCTTDEDNIEEHTIRDTYIT